ncbi:MAG TPA: energy transducer TonB [Anaeromyxobacter sp.]
MTHLGPSLRRAKVRERPGRRIAIAALVSILLNSFVFLLLERAGAFSLPSRPTRVTLTPLSASQWSANRAVGPNSAAPRPQSPKPPAAKAPEPPEPVAKGQIVDVAPSPDSTAPKSSRFLSDRDNSVAKETRSRYARPGYERTLPTPQAPGAQSAPAPGKEGKLAKELPGSEGQPAAPAAPKGAPKVALAPEASGDLAGARAAGEEGRAPTSGEGEGGQRKSGPLSDLLHVTPGTLARLSGGPAPDRLDGVDEGEGTFLNTRGWKYATYFNRIKQQVAAAWDPMSPLDARDPDRSMFGYKDRYTLLGVTLDDTGHVKNLVVEQTSGAEFLDRAALTAFRTAQPFVNPPRGIVDQNGEIRFSFGFFLEVGRPGMRIYRAPLPAMP